MSFIKVPLENVLAKMYIILKRKTTVKINQHIHYIFHLNTYIYFKEMKKEEKTHSHIYISYILPTQSKQNELQEILGRGGGGGEYS